MSDLPLPGKAAPRAIVFDLDNTLAPSKSPLDPSMAALLGRVLDVALVAVISGGQFEQFRKQVIAPLDAAGATGLRRLHLLPACGTQYFEYDGADWHRAYLEALTDDEKSRTFAALEQCARELSLWEENTWGPVLEDRESQVTFSALGQSAPVDEKKKWDPSGDKKRVLRDAVDARLPDLEVRAGGSTSIDVTRKGRDKGFGVRRLLDVTGLSTADLLFYGDQLEPGGNDYAVKELGVPCVAVANWRETAGHLEEFLGKLA